MSSEAVVDLAQGALTYRQLQYWTQHGLVQARRHHNSTGAHITGSGHGSGTSYGWDLLEACRIRAAAFLIRATGMRPEAALELARRGRLAIPAGEGEPLAITFLPRHLLGLLLN